MCPSHQVATEKIIFLSEEYRDVARRGSVLYFVITDLHKMNSLYVYSLNAFVAIFQVRCAQTANNSGVAFEFNLEQEVF